MRMNTCNDEAYGAGTLFLDRMGIEGLLPHRVPALLIDEIRTVEDRRYTRFLPEGRHFEGHFPDNPILPAHYIMEAAALTGLAETLIRHFEGQKMGILAGEMMIKPKKSVKPGHPVYLTVEEAGELVHRSGIYYVNGVVSASCDGILVAVAHISGTVFPLS